MLNEPEILVRTKNNATLAEGEPPEIHKRTLTKVEHCAVANCIFHPERQSSSENKSLTRSKNLFADYLDLEREAVNDDTLKAHQKTSSVPVPDAWGTRIKADGSVCWN